MHNTGHLSPDQIRTPLTAAQRMAAGIPHRVVRLKGPFSALLGRIGKLGVVTVLTGNDSVIQEHTGIYDDTACRCAGDLCSGESAHPPRPFHQQWKYGFAVDGREDDGHVGRLLQFFDADGNGVHKILLHDSGSADAFHAIVSDFTAAEQSPVLDILHTALSAATGKILRVDVDALRTDWACADQTAVGFMGQTEFDSGRLHKLRLVGKAFAHQVGKDSVRIVLQKMADLGCSVVTLTGNAGVMQAYQGQPEQIRSGDAWLDILNRDYRLRLREDHIDTVWVAKKPTADGIMTSLELFNRRGVGFARFFSEPEPGKPEPHEWREAILRLLPVFGA
jgi:putative hemin transport protein